MQPAPWCAPQATRCASSAPRNPCIAIRRSSVSTPAKPGGRTMHEPPRLEFDGAQALVTLCDPELSNALSLDQVKRLRECVAEASANDAVRVLRLRAEGEVFCAGRATGGGAPGASGEAMRATLIAPIQDLYRALHATDLVTIAEVQGDAHGLGCALVAACDLAVASTNARFSLPEMGKHLPPTLALSVMVPRVTPRVAAHLVLAMNVLDARAALAAGIVGEVVEA